MVSILVNLEFYQSDDVGKFVSITGEIVNIQTLFRGNNIITIAHIFDSSLKIMKVYFFSNRSWIIGQLKKGAFRTFCGKVRLVDSEYALVHPTVKMAHEPIDDTTENQLVPKYRGGILSSEQNVIIARNVRKYIDIVLNKQKVIIPEPLPLWVIHNYKLEMTKDEALKEIHFPKSKERLEKALRRMKFEELFFLMYYLKKCRRERKKYSTRMQPQNGNLVDQFLKNLQFKLTPGQQNAIQAIIKDVTSCEQMNRLIQGDVGCGKTIVAVAALLLSVDCGRIGVFLAPTELLAEQHFSILRQHVEPLGIKVQLIIGAQTKAQRKEIIESIETGKTQIVVGTHALLHHTVGRIVFKNAGITVIDEFCKFGVRQRETVFKFGSQHLLLMSATPIPRSLGMVLYGDLDITLIKDMPHGRKPVITRIFHEKDRRKMYDLLLEQLSQGKQAYIVHPLVYPSSKLMLKSAESAYEEMIQNPLFSKYKIGLVHGQMSSNEKEQQMQKFKNCEYHILVTTTIVEAGIDIKNATIIVIENAERYGLAQLHQLRGRVGRSSSQGYCFLMIKDPVNENERSLSLERLEVICKSNDGFYISEMDLKFRGMGNIVGEEQSGFLDAALKLAKIPEDMDILIQAKSAVDKLNSVDPMLTRKFHGRTKNETNYIYANWKYLL